MVRFVAIPGGNRSNHGCIWLMPYYTKVLQPDEKVQAVGRPHWFIYGRGGFLLAIAIALLIFSGTVSDRDWQYYTMMAAGVVAFLALLLLLGAWIRRRSTEIAVTDRRIILNFGLLSRRTLEMNMSQVEMVDVQQSVSGRIWGYGTVVIRGSGGDVEPLVRISSPIRIRNAVLAR